ncbi:MAG: transmembrane 220 family protein [Saprospiraceae bacterium]|nr:transmembrane 220 family protein [Saprospiraceae bacterium]
MKAVHFLLGGYFILCALLQYNDPDPIQWMFVYAAIAFVCIMNGLQKPFSRYLYYAIFGVTTLWAIAFIPDFIRWINMGMPNITGSMKAENEYIETTREFLGLTIGVFALLFESKYLIKLSY